MRLLCTMAAVALAACVSNDPVPEPHVSTPPVFTDRTTDLGVEFVAAEPDVLPGVFPDRRAGGGAALTDLGDDGDLDIILTSPFGGSAVFLNEGGAFTRTETALDDIEGVFGVAAVDLDGDGAPEALLSTVQGLRLFRGVGGGFEELPPLLESDGTWRPVGVSVADADGDGEADIYVATWGVTQDPIDIPVDGRDRLFRGMGGLQFEEVDLPTTWGHTFAAAWLDADDDGDLDVYAVKDFGVDVGPNVLLQNQGDMVFTEGAAELGLDLGFNAMGVDHGDIDADGRTEVVFSDTDRRLQVWSIDHAVGAVDVAAALGAVSDAPWVNVDSWGIELHDVDDDGDLDLLAPWGHKEFDAPFGPQRCSLWTWGTYGFEDVSEAALPPLDSMTWRSVLPGDLNGDGATDLLWTSQVGPISVQLGAPTGNHWLEVELPSPRGLGARVEVGGRWEVVAPGGSGLHSSLPPVARFGLGAATSASVRVRGPDGSTSEFEDVSADERLIVD